MIRRERRSVRFVVGVILVTLFAILCIVPLVYMVLVSFADTYHVHPLGGHQAL